MSQAKQSLINQQAQVTYADEFVLQVCVPESWADEQVQAFANKENLAGTTNGWQVRKEGDEALNGDPERRPCAQREGFVHIMLDC